MCIRARDLLELAGIGAKNEHEDAKKNGAKNGSSSRFRVMTTARKEVS